MPPSSILTSDFFQTTACFLSLPQDLEFELFARRSDGSVVAVRYCGAWFMVNRKILPPRSLNQCMSAPAVPTSCSDNQGLELPLQQVDNGYLSWSVTVPPMKAPSSVDEILWSKYLESMRKDVECCFGILKGRQVWLV